MALYVIAANYIAHDCSVNGRVVLDCECSYCPPVRVSSSIATAQLTISRRKLALAFVEGTRTVLQLAWECRVVRGLSET